jgi:hypothetical protein
MIKTVSMLLFLRYTFIGEQCYVNVQRGKGMDTYPLLRKYLVVGIILLFVGTCVITAIGQELGKTFLLTSEEKNPYFDTTQHPLPPPTRWMKQIGGRLGDVGYSVQQTIDGGYIITGETASFGAGEYDVWFLKTNSTGDIEWNKSFGGLYCDEGYCVSQTHDGGYIITGATSSFNAGDYDVWLIKTDENGEMLWNRTFGGTSWDEGCFVQETTDGGYIIIGRSDCLTATGDEVWLIKIDSDGKKIWDRTFGGRYLDRGNSGQQTSDGGYIITGVTYSSVTRSYDMWLIKTNSVGTMLWNKTFGGSGWDEGYCVQQTTDGGYIITGTSSNNGYNMDVFLVKTDSNGNTMWEKSFNETNIEYAKTVHQTTDGGYIITGTTFKYNHADVWLIKTNSTGDIEWERVFGPPFYYAEWGYSGTQTTDGGYILAGTTNWNCSAMGDTSDLWLLKTDENGLLSNPPNIPSITGEITGSKYTSYNYSLQTIDVDQDTVRYYIDWGDNTSTTTLLYDSGKKINISHAWEQEGTYTIKVKSIDINYAESDWATLTVTMPCSYNRQIPQFLNWLFQRFPHAFPLLRQLMGY